MFLCHGKTRSAPIREWTIPCLELQDAVPAARLSKIILKELDLIPLPVGQFFFWSYSMTSLQYIKNETRSFQIFVTNRVAEIHETSSPEQWHDIAKFPMYQQRIYKMTTWKYGSHRLLCLSHMHHREIKQSSEQGRCRGLDDFHILHFPLYTHFCLPMMHRPGAQAALFPVPTK